LEGVDHDLHAVAEPELLEDARDATTSQLANFLRLIWIVAASAVLGVRRSTPMGAVAPAGS
jgi:hypothetical protein